METYRTMDYWTGENPVNSLVISSHPVSMLWRPEKILEKER